ncbi:glycoside hydrolase family 16 protein, partial [Xanthovirga aplysinae]|uniref:glycoside hydrolase family 16 protein n=1 Tax=Xanthovirga aplysinae TaxID=2529853 RepID=UPI0012BCE82F
MKKAYLLTATFIGLLFFSCNKDEKVDEVEQTIDEEEVVEEPTTDESEYVLVWSDEFDGTTLDQTKWSYLLGDGTSFGLPSGWGNNELQYYTNQNATVNAGTLKITAKEESMGGKNYTSTRLESKNKGDWTYGKFEARMRLPIGQGIWPAFWMLPTDNVYGGWPQSGEIDIMEYLGHQPNVVHGTVHYGLPWPDNSHYGNPYRIITSDFNQDFHIFGIEWEPEEIRWYVDGIHYSTVNPTTIGENWPFDQNFHLLLNLAVGGDWPGNPDASTVFPQTLEVDYVRVYTKEN